MKYEDEVRIRQHWFPNHKATYTEHGDLKVLTWKKDGTIAYSVRYVFDGGRMYVTGDLGEAAFCFTEKADLHVISQYSLDYFEEKMRAYHGKRRDFDSDQAVARLREWVKQLKENQVEYDHDEMRELFDKARSCSSTDEWAHAVNSQYEFVSDLDCDYWDWMYGIGDQIPIRLRGYLIGLKMAAEQLEHQTKATA